MPENNRQAPSAARAIDGAVTGLLQGLLSAPGNLASEVERLHAVREETLGLLGEVSAEQALWSPRRGAWSIAQIADHLLRSEELYRDQFRRLIQMAREGKSSSIELSLREVNTSIAAIPRDVMRLFEVPMRMFNLFLPHAVRETLVRYPLVSALNPGVSDPRPGLSLEKLKQDLAAALTQTESLLRAPMPPNIERPTIVHPLLGKNNLPQLLRILIAHEERHQGQIAGIRTSAGFPN
jgi:uncharacterized damage-inducible protein DinB